jgi:hypothetical protein
VDVPQGSGVMWVFALPDRLPDARLSAAPPVPPVASTPAARVVQRPTRSVTEGVFTRAQAARGEQAFKQACATCHKIEDHSGTSFTTKWSNASLGDIFDQMSLTMPPAKPGSLPPDGYADILAHFLQRTGFPEGGAELPPDAGTLRGIRAGQ